MNIKVNQTNISYERCGKGNTIVFLHGAYLSKEEWKYQVQFFKKDFDVITLDLPGHGDSDKPKEYSISEYASTIYRFFKELNINNIILCGHSLGGMVAQEIALKYPNEISKLVLADTSFGVRSNRFESLMTTLTMPILRHIRVSTQAKLFSGQLGKHSSEVKNYIYNEVIKHNNDSINFFKIWNSIVEFSSKSLLSKISIPTLVVVGQNNKQTHKQAIVFSTLIPNSRLVHIENAGHMLNMDNHYQLNNEIQKFIV